MKDPVSIRFIEFIEMLDLTQSRFAESLDLPAPRISDIKHGKTRPSTNIIEKTIEIFGLNPSWLFTGNGQPRIPGGSLKGTLNYKIYSMKESDLKMVRDTSKNRRFRSSSKFATPIIFKPKENEIFLQSETTDFNVFGTFDQCDDNILFLHVKQKIEYKDPSLVFEYKTLVEVQYSNDIKNYIFKETVKGPFEPGLYFLSLSNRKEKILSIQYFFVVSD